MALLFFPIYELVCSSCWQPRRLASTANEVSEQASRSRLPACSEQSANYHYI